MGSKYTGEFKMDALRVCEREGVSAAHEKLGVPEKTLYLWQRQARLERGGVIKGFRPAETVEEGYRRQERENAELREVNQILKKAMGFMVSR